MDWSIPGSHSSISFSSLTTLTTIRPALHTKDNIKVTSRLTCLNLWLTTFVCLIVKMKFVKWVFLVIKFIIYLIMLLHNIVQILLLSSHYVSFMAKPLYNQLGALNKCIFIYFSFISVFWHFRICCLEYSLYLKMFYIVVQLVI